MTKVEQFKQDLENLVEKYGIIINGCGCCGSPYLDDLINTNGKYNDPDEFVSDMVLQFSEIDKSRTEFLQNKEEKYKF